jgi:hypothetical protein
MVAKTGSMSPIAVPPMKLIHAYPTFELTGDDNRTRFEQMVELTFL